MADLIVSSYLQNCGMGTTLLKCIQCVCLSQLFYIAYYVKQTLSEIPGLIKLASNVCNRYEIHYVWVRQQLPWLP